jgi:hypothetical protein
MPTAELALSALHAVVHNHTLPGPDRLDTVSGEHHLAANSCPGVRG